MSDKVQEWKKLNKRHNEINRFFCEVYNGPDVNESFFQEQPAEIADKSRSLLTERDKVHAQKLRLESQMTDQEFEQTL